MKNVRIDIDIKRADAVEWFVECIKNGGKGKNVTKNEELLIIAT